MIKIYVTEPQRGDIIYDDIIRNQLYIAPLEL